MHIGHTPCMRYCYSIHCSIQFLVRLFHFSNNTLKSSNTAQCKIDLTAIIDVRFPKKDITHNRHASYSRKIHYTMQISTFELHNNNIQWMVRQIFIIHQPLSLTGFLFLMKSHCFHSAKDVVAVPPHPLLASCT